MEAVSVVRPTYCNKSQVPRVSMSGIRSNRRQPPALQMKHVVKQLLCTLAGLLKQNLLKMNIKSFLHLTKQHITGKYGGAEVRLHAFRTSQLEGRHRSDSLPSHLPQEKKPTISLD